MSRTYIVQYNNRIHATGRLRSEVKIFVHPPTENKDRVRPWGQLELRPETNFDVTVPSVSRQRALDSVHQEVGPTTSTRLL